MLTGELNLTCEAAESLVGKKKKPGEAPASGEGRKTGRAPVGKPIGVRFHPEILKRMEAVEEVLSLDHSTLIRLIVSENLHIYEARARLTKPGREG